MKGQLPSLLLAAALLLAIVVSFGTAEAIPFEYVQGTDLLIQYNGPPWSGPAVQDISHLQWLNVGQLTLGQTYNSILKQTQPGGPFEGFRFATSYEVLGLFHALGYKDWNLQAGESPVNILQ